ncbi:Sensor histidine kinase RcsC [Candidatus Magnetaquicoccaceae bacterium FCR-1]|uniref:histidine kinase n=1 Tax=Candidatus Magnetaquiglobus chichijimensis TaxID=3141448 RepID=A0ABQ0CAR4_9PROT
MPDSLPANARFGPPFQEPTAAERALTLLKQCHKLVRHEKSEVVMLSRACDLLVEEGGYRFAWCGLVADDADRTITPVAHARLDAERLQAFRRIWLETGSRQEPARAAIRSNATATLNNLLEDPLAGVWREQAEDHGYAAALAVPFKDGEHLFGVLNLYAADPWAFEPAEIELISELADALAFGVLAAHESKRRRKAERELSLHRQLLEEQVAKRTRVLNTVAAIAQRLLFHGGWRQNVDAVLADLGRAANVSRAYIFRTLGLEGELFGWIHEWCAPGILPEMDPDDDQDVDPERFGLSRWRQRLAKGEHLSGRTRDFAKPERDFLSERGILSIAVMPILVHERLWGVLGFEDSRRERTWSSGEIDAMQLAANTLDAAIRKDRLMEEKRADESLIRKLSAAVEQSPNIVLITDAEGRIEYVNPRFTQITGYPAHETLGGTPLILQDQSRSERDCDLMWQTLHEGLAWREEIQSQRKDGSLYWVQASLSPLVDGEGRVTHFVCIQEDVTHRKESELRLREAFDKLAKSENRMQAILDNMPSLVCLKDRAGRYLLANRLFSETFGLDPKRIIGRGDMELFPEDVAQGFIESDRTVLQRGVQADVDMIIPLAGDKRIFHTVRFPVVADESGHFSICGIATDITERRIAQARLLRSKQAQDILNGLLFSAMETTSFLRDFIREALTRILSAPWFMPEGKGAIYLFGAAENGGDVVCQIGLPEEGNEERVGKALLETAWGVQTPGIVFIRAHDWPGGAIPGVPEQWGYYSAPLSPGGLIKGVIQIFLPPTHTCNKDEEDFLATVRNTLASIVEKKIVDRQLILAKEKAESASHAKSTFLANMSHEVRTPMNGVIGMLALLSKTRMNPIQKQYLSIALQSAELQLNVINDILDFSKIEAGRLVLEQIPFDPRELVDNVGAMLSGAAHGKGLELMIHFSWRIPSELIGDPVRLRQVLINLTGNAIKFTLNGEVVIRADLVRETDDKARICFYVLDTGIGISDQARDRLFQPFVQADDSTTRRFGGTGLGLVIARQIVEAMGGVIGLSSQPEGGSLFWFEVEFSRPPGALSVSPPALCCKKVLVIDDCLTNRMIFQNYFQSWQVGCDGASSGEEGLAMVRSASDSPDGAYDVVIVDMRMSGLDGLQVARRMREEGSIPRPKVMLLSCGIHLEESVLSEAGVGAFVMKPVGPRRLARALELLFKPESAGGGETPDAATNRPEGRLLGKVLLVEDTFVNQQVAASMLKQMGFEVEIARDGEEGVARAMAGRPDLILMDMQMPGMDGLEATRRIREWETRLGTGEPMPIIAMTANALSGDRERCLESGMNDYLAKPVLWDALLNKLSQWLPHWELEEPPPAPEVRSEIEETGGPALDPDVLERFWMAMKEVPGTFTLVIEEFLASTPGLLERIERAGVKNEDEVVRGAAHALKSNSATVGAMALSELCAVIEKAARVGDTLPAVRLHSAAVYAFQSAVPELTQALAREAEGSCVRGTGILN